MTNPDVRTFSDDLDATSIDKDDPNRVTRYALMDAIVAVVLDNGDVVPSENRRVRAMIDTGATSSAVAKSLAKDLGLKKAGSETGVGIDSKAGKRTLYRAHLQLLKLPVAWKALLLETEAGQNLFDIIIGNDLLAGLTFTVDGPTNKFTLSYIVPRS